MSKTVFPCCCREREYNKPNDSISLRSIFDRWLLISCDYSHREYNATKKRPSVVIFDLCTISIFYII